ncbi:MAG: SpoIIE family protein phosphatase [Thermoanaerobaculia bacterium]|nr:SpoIIE family protein phosphatase [Thermoanaerobaculia bacterium]
MSRATLRIEPRDGSPYDLRLGTEEVTLGRGESNTVQFRDPWLSRLHARVLWRNGAHVLVDAGSRNGTFLNGERLTGRQELKPGDHVTLGNVLLRYLHDVVKGFEVSDSKTALKTAGTLMISSDELNLDLYRRKVRERADAALASELLPTINEVASSLLAHVPLTELTELLLDRVVRAVPAERGALLLRTDRGHGPLEVHARYGYRDHSQVRISRTIIEAAVDGHQAILTVDALSDERFEHAQSVMMQGIRSVLCVPIGDRLGGVLGLIYLDHRVANKVFNETTLRLVGLIANLATVKIENCWLLEDQNEKRRMEEQLAVGAQIQRGLLPAAVPELPGYDLAGLNRSCFEVGGDYYDFLQKDDGKLALIVADISGKGVAAALLMAVLQASIRALVPMVSNPTDLMNRLNRALVENTPDNRFATVFYGELDPRAHRLEYVSGGHNPCLLWTPGQGMQTLDSSGPIVGLVSRASYTSRVVELPAGSTLMLYTDGVTELLTEEGGEFGLDPLFEILRSSDDAGAHDVIDRVHDQMHAYIGSDRLDDDSTLVVLRRLRKT